MRIEYESLVSGASFALVDYYLFWRCHVPVVPAMLVSMAAGLGIGLSLFMLFGRGH